MDITELYDECRQIEQIIEQRGLIAHCRAGIHAFGDELCIDVSAREEIHENGYWSSERSFAGRKDEAERLVREAGEWASQIPGEEDRAVEMMIKKLNELASKLPKGHGEIAQTAWSEIHRMLMAKADTLALNGLPSPARIKQSA